MDYISYRIAPISLVKTTRIPNQNRGRIHPKKRKERPRLGGQNPNHVPVPRTCKSSPDVQPRIAVMAAMWLSESVCPNVLK